MTTDLMSGSTWQARCLNAVCSGTEIWAVFDERPGGEQICPSCGFKSQLQRVVLEDDRDETDE